MFQYRSFAKQCEFDAARVDEETSRCSNEFERLRLAVWLTDGLDDRDATAAASICHPSLRHATTRFLADACSHLRVALSCTATLHRCR